MRWRANRGKISRRGGKNNLGRELDQFLRESGGTVGIAAIPAILDAQISAIKISDGAQPLDERRHVRL